MKFLSLKDANDHRASTTFFSPSMSCTLPGTLLVAIVNAKGELAPIKAQNRLLSEPILWKMHSLRVIGKTQPIQHKNTMINIEKIPSYADQGSVKVEAWLEDTKSPLEVVGDGALPNEAKQRDPLEPTISKRVRRVKGTKKPDEALESTSLNGLTPNTQDVQAVYHNFDLLIMDDPKSMPLPVSGGSMQPLQGKSNNKENELLIDIMPDELVDVSSHNSSTSQRKAPSQQSRRGSTPTSGNQWSRSSGTQWSIVSNHRSHNLLDLSERPSHPSNNPAIRNTMQQKASFREPVTRSSLRCQEEHLISILAAARGQVGHLSLKLELGRLLIDSGSVPHTERMKRQSKIEWEKLMSSHEILVDFTNRYEVHHLLETH